MDNVKIYRTASKDASFQNIPKKKTEPDKMAYQFIEIDLYKKEIRIIWKGGKAR